MNKKYKRRLVEEDIMARNDTKDHLKILIKDTTKQLENIKKNVIVIDNDLKEALKKYGKFKKR